MQLDSRLAHRAACDLPDRRILPIVFNGFQEAGRLVGAPVENGGTGKGQDRFRAMVMTFPLSVFSGRRDFKRSSFVRSLRRASYPPTGNGAPVVVDFAALEEGEGHGRLASRMAYTSDWVKSMRLPITRQAPVFRAISRIRRSDQPVCRASASGVVNEGAHEGISDSACEIEISDMVASPSGQGKALHGREATHRAALIGGEVGTAT